MARLPNPKAFAFKRAGDRLIIQWDERALALAPNDVVELMRSGSPAIECSFSEGLQIDVATLQPGEDERVAARLAEIFDV